VTESSSVSGVNPSNFELDDGGRKETYHLNNVAKQTIDRGQIKKIGVDYL
jgi:hypothetical protein